MSLPTRTKTKTETEAETRTGFQIELRDSQVASSTPEIPQQPLFPPTTGGSGDNHPIIYVIVLVVVTLSLGALLWPWWGQASAKEFFYTAVVSFAIAYLVSAWLAEMVVRILQSEELRNAKEWVGIILDLKSPAEAIVIRPSAFVRSMVVIAWVALRHPLSTTLIDLRTGAVVEDEDLGREVR